MNILVWVVQGVLAAVFVGAGTMKLTTPRKRLIDRGAAMAWVGDFSDGTVKAIGAAELLGGIGLVLPAAVGVAVVLTPVAAAALAVVMAGAVVTHIRRDDPVAAAVPAAVLGLLALFVAIMRFGPYAF